MKDKKEDKKEEKKEVIHEVYIKQIRAHQKGFRLGRHVISAGIPKKYALNEAEYKELKTKGPASWIKEVEKEEVEKMKKISSLGKDKK